MTLKQMAKQQSRIAITLLIIMCVAVFAPVILAACQTVTTSPDGTITKRTDIDTTIAITQLALQSTQELYTIYQQATAAQLMVTQSEKDRIEREKQARIEQLKATLQTLIELRNQYVSGTVSK